MSVNYATAGGAFALRQKPQVRIEKLGGFEFDLAPDGRIAVPTLLDTAKTAPPAEHTVVFVQNFADEVRRRVK